jgi:hypothetical protein
MNHDKLDAAVMVDGRMAGIEPRAAGASGQGNQRKNNREKFHGEGMPEESNATV